MGEEWRGVHGGVDYNRHIVIPVLMYIYITRKGRDCGMWYFCSLSPQHSKGKRTYPQLLRLSYVLAIYIYGIFHYYLLFIQCRTPRE